MILDHSSIQEQRMHELHLTEGAWLQRFLLSQPESGMGYQQVELHLRDGRIIPNLIVRNAEIVLLPEEYNNVAENDIEIVAVLNGATSKNPAL